MQVILLQDVAKLGRRHEIVEVPHGHGLNRLIPQGFAVEATPENVKRVKAQASKVEADHAAADETFAAALSALEGKTLTIAAPANEQGHLFEAVKPERVVEAAAAAGATVTPAQIHIGTPLKSVGTHTVALISGEQRGDVMVEVTAA